jgi:hypothetical protein
MADQTSARHNRLSRRGFMRTGIGAATAALAVPTISGIASAHFHGPDKPALNIDIKPDSDKNRINPQSQGVVPVAVLQTEEFDPTSKNVNYRFGAPNVVEHGKGARPLHDGHVEDVNGDGMCDLVLHFPVEDTGFDGDEQIGSLHWEKGHKGAHHGLGGSDAITISGGKQSDHQHRLGQSVQTQSAVRGGRLRSLLRYLR